MALIVLVMEIVRRNSWLVALAALLLLSSCREKQRADVISPKKLEAVLYDYHLAQVMIGDLPSSERYKKDFYFDYIYDKHGVTEELFDSSLVYYARYPKELSVIYEKMAGRLERELRRVEEEGAEMVHREAIGVSGDSADLWYDARIIQLASSPLENRYAFTVPADTNFKAGDKIVWEGDVLFLNEVVDSTRHYLYMNLQVKYANDTLRQVDTLLYASGNYLLQVVDTSGWMIKNVSGSAYLKNVDAVGCLLMVSPSLMRYRAAESSVSLSVDTVSADISDEATIKVASGKQTVERR